MGNVRRRKHHFAIFLFWVYHRAMNNVTAIPIESFTVAEKLLLMERLWEDLSKQPSNVASPEWHGDVLAARLAAVKEGRSEFVDWDAAKERLSSGFALLRHQFFCRWHYPARLTRKTRRATAFFQSVGASRTENNSFSQEVRRNVVSMSAKLGFDFCRYQGRLGNCM